MKSSDVDTRTWLCQQYLKTKLLGCEIAKEEGFSPTRAGASPPACEAGGDRCVRIVPGTNSWGWRTARSRQPPPRAPGAGLQAPAALQREPPARTKTGDGRLGPQHRSGRCHKPPVPRKGGMKPGRGRSASAALAKDGAAAAEGRSLPPGAGRRRCRGPMTSVGRAEGARGFPVLLSWGPAGWEAGARGGAAGADGGSLGSPRLRAGGG